MNDDAVRPPVSHAGLLELPLFSHVATVRPDGAPQSSVMWFAWDGSRIRFSHTKGRQKFVNLASEPRVALSIIDPDDPYRFLEVRGKVESIDDDDEAASFYRILQDRYGESFPVPADHDRVVITIRPHHFVAVVNGKVVRDI